MDILGQLISGAMGGQGTGANPQIDVGGLASQFGLSPEQANNAVGALLPAILGGIQKTEDSAGLDRLGQIVGNMGAPEQDIASGNSILGQIFGSKDVSRQVASQASQQTGISDTILKAMLPVVAGLVAQQVAKRMGGGMMGGLAGAVVGSMLGGSAANAASSSGDGGLSDILGGLANTFGGSGPSQGDNPLDQILGGMLKR